MLSSGAFSELSFGSESSTSAKVAQPALSD
jgi:hypothetical protein